ncbi:MAG: transcriptional repressor [Propionibacteriaceae bacterium]|nr:transcriptional repressor [Propionibacteriaceae bacterium]
MSTERRNTRQRSAVRELLAHTSEFRTAQQLHEMLRRKGHSIGMATVYRALQAMAEAGEVDMLRTAEGEATYRRCSTGHHHHLVCRECGTTVEIAAEQVETWAEAVARQHGFSQVDHSLELFGRCSRCSGDESGTHQERQ